MKELVNMYMRNCSIMNFTNVKAKVNRMVRHCLL